MTATPVHPHGCGEHAISTPMRAKVAGSSPRVWGTSTSSKSLTWCSRFIPTGVGNISAPPDSGPLITVHPHGCGEHYAPWGVDSTEAGSSPRVWGTFHVFYIRTVNMRFIPTGVGNIFCPLAWNAKGTVHPHGCGEHVLFVGAESIIHGSSPRVWGTFMFIPSGLFIVRFIPTGVGNIRRFWCFGNFWTVHPHGCGEHQADSDRPGKYTGSSPRVWGTLHRR